MSWGQNRMKKLNFNTFWVAWCSFGLNQTFFRNHYRLRTSKSIIRGCFCQNLPTKIIWDIHIVMCWSKHTQQNWIKLKTPCKQPDIKSDYFPLPISTWHVSMIQFFRDLFDLANICKLWAQNKSRQHLRPTLLWRLYREVVHGYVFWPVCLGRPFSIAFPSQIPSNPPGSENKFNFSLAQTHPLFPIYVAILLRKIPIIQ